MSDDVEQQQERRLDDLFARTREYLNVERDIALRDLAGAKEYLAQAHQAVLSAKARLLWEQKTRAMALSRQIQRASEFCDQLIANPQNGN